MGAPAHKARVVGWGVNIEKFSGRSNGQWRAMHGIAEDRTVILSPRRWIRNSNIPMIVDAFARVRQQRDDDPEAQHVDEDTLPGNRPVGELGIGA